MSVAALTAATAVLTAGCAIGQRPTLADEPASTGDPIVDELVARLEDRPPGRFQAEYLITNNFGPIERLATVAHLADGRRSVTVGEVRFLFGAGPTSTCAPSGTSSYDCTDVVDDATISDMQVTHQFYDRSAAVRLVADATRRIGPLDSYVAEFAGRAADCVSIPVTGGTKVYCILPEGILATYQGPDVLIELTAFSDTVDETLFGPHT